MKRLNLVIIVLSISFTIVIFIALVSKKHETLKITTFEKAYNLISTFQEEDELSIDIYINQDETYINDNSSVVSCMVSDQNGNNQLSLKLKDINKLDQVQLSNNNFYLYNFTFTILLQTDELFSLELDDAFLVINYQQEETIKLAIGSFSLYKIPNFGCEDLQIYQLKGLVNDFNNMKTIVGLGIGFINKSNETIKITKVIPLDTNVMVSNQDVILCDGSFSPNTNINLILGYDYQLSNGNSESSLSIDLEEGFYLFPLKYKKERSINKIGLLIEYEINGEMKKMYYDDFTFFTNSYYTKEEVSELVFYTYENH